MTTIDKRTAVRLLKKAVKTHGRDRTVGAGSCYYADRGDKTVPVCLVGQVIHGVVGPKTFSVMFQDGYINSHVFNDGLAEILQTNHDLHITKGAMTVLRTAQDVQDGRSLGSNSWGTALDTALTV